MTLVIDGLYSFSTSYRLILFLILLVPLLCFAGSTLSYKVALREKGQNKTPPTVPYAIPLLFHALEFAWSPIDFITKTTTKYGWQNPLRARVGWFSFTIVSNPSQIQTVFRSSKQLSSKPGVLFALKYLLNAPSSAISWYDADNSGLANVPSKGNTTEHVNRIHFHQARAAQKFISNQHLVDLSGRYLKTLQRDLGSTDVAQSEEWVEYPDLYHFLQMNVTRAMIETLMGTKLLELNPNFVEDFWKFDSHVPKFLRAFPRWMMPAAYRARDRLLENIKAWHAWAHAHADCSRIEDEDPEWEPYFGSKLVRARQDYASKMKFMNADARASEDLGLLMASNGNAVPSVFWYIYEVLKNDGVRQRMIREVETCTSLDGYDIQKLTTQPLLQSAYAEVLRLRVAIAMARQSDSEPFNIGGYQVPVGEPFVIFSRHPALNKEAWSLAGRPPPENAPLETFCAERFLVPKKPTKDRQADEKALDKEDTDLEFSLDGLAGLWIPYGGGQRMCPGRHFAKSEIIGTFALLITQYDLELIDADNISVEPDLRWFPSGALPPVGKVPFRIRRRMMGIH